MPLKTKSADFSPSARGPTDPLPVTQDRMSLFVNLLHRWCKATNLVSEASLRDVWARHIHDSAQLLALVPNSRKWLDLGTGAGFPGIVIAIQLSKLPDGEVHCVESDRRKCAFLREVVRATGVRATIHACRIEHLDTRAVGTVDAVTARALAPLPKLIEFSKYWLNRGAIGVFPRGSFASQQISRDSAPEHFDIEMIQSKTDPQGKIARVIRAAKVQS